MTSLIFEIKTENEFNKRALAVFNHQYQLNKVFKQYVDLIKVIPEKVRHYADIPFLPIQFFKNHIVSSSDENLSAFFESSGTTGEKSRHYYKDLALYEESFSNGFNLFYGNHTDYVVLALLPSYVDNPHASLVYMVNKLISQSSYSESDFYHNKEKELFDALNMLKNKNVPCILFGVSFALLDFVEKYQVNFPDLIVMETGGMKGRRKEIIREELHEKLCKGFNVKTIHSEYGMTELFSQSYSKGNGVFYAPPWKKILVRDIYDSLSVNKNAASGAINIIDLANIDSVSFIATDDVGVVHQDGSFSVTGRLDSASVRGCNLMLT